MRMRAAFLAYMGGRGTSDAAEAAGVSKGSVSGYLNEIEAAIGVRVVRGRADERSMTALLKTDKMLLNSHRAAGLRRASIRDFHSFRVTWVTLALTAGMPLEMVQRVTGHKTADVVLKHYFKPGREAFRLALTGAMPAVLTGEAEKLETGNSKQVLAKPQRPQSEVVVLAGKVAAGSATKAEKARLGMLLGA